MDVASGRCAGGLGSGSGLMVQGLDEPERPFCQSGNRVASALVQIGSDDPLIDAGQRLDF